MTTETEKPQTTQEKTEPPTEKILCPHCLRTATNGIKCQGICVADDGY
ncbi:hypothetical protein NIES2104_46740 [Leptolyngbya sp. NIES-2104]|nr:hypothetical protein NIES2104_46740 [Leptolyngbya sp. NIES-2104]